MSKDVGRRLVWIALTEKAGSHSDLRSGWASPNAWRSYEYKRRGWTESDGISSMRHIRQQLAEQELTIAWRLGVARGAPEDEDWRGKLVLPFQRDGPNCKDKKQ